MLHHRSIRRGALALASTLGLIAALGLPGASSATVPEASGAVDAVAFVPYSGPDGTILHDEKKRAFELFATDWAFGGQFSGAPGGDVFLYNPGSAPDGVLHLDTTGPSPATIFTPKNVGGTFRPLVGDYDGNGISDIFWYAAGSARDYIWLFQEGGAHTTVNSGVSGSYRPVVVDANGDGRDDIIWYGPGSISDSLWLMGPGGTSKTIKPLSIGGNYIAAVGRLGVPGPGQPAERVVWYSQTGTDWFWTFDSSGNHTSDLLPSLNGDYTPIVGRVIEESYGTIYWYRPGAGVEQLWAFGPGAGGDVAVQDSAPQVGGTYVPVTADLDDNGYTDIVWSATGTANVWHWDFDGPSNTTITGLPTNAMPVAMDMD